MQERITYGEAHIARDVALCFDGVGAEVWRE